jgi:hypothetical protein
MWVILSCFYGANLFYFLLCNVSHFILFLLCSFVLLLLYSLQTILLMNNVLHVLHFFLKSTSWCACENCATGVVFVCGFQTVWTFWWRVIVHVIVKHPEVTHLVWFKGKNSSSCFVEFQGMWRRFVLTISVRVWLSINFLLSVYFFPIHSPLCSNFPSVILFCSCYFFRLYFPSTCLKIKSLTVIQSPGISS